MWAWVSDSSGGLNLKEENTNSEELGPGEGETKEVGRACKI